MKEERAIKRRRRKIKFWVKFLIFLIICGSLAFALKAPLFEVKNYQVEGNSYYTDEEILIMGNCRTGGNIFIGTDLKDIRTRLGQDAYMADVKVSRTLPDTITIELDERHQIGAVVYGSKYVVVDHEGTVLRRTSVEPKLTVIDGLTISKLSLGEPIEAEEKVLLRQTLEMLSVMEANDMYFKRIELAETEIRAYVLDSLICKGTPEHIMTAMKNKEIQIVVQELFDKKIERGTVVVSGDNKISFNPKID